MSDSKPQGAPYEGTEEEKRLRETGGWPEGVQPGAGNGAELDEALEAEGEGSDPAAHASAVPGFVPEPDPNEWVIEGGGVAEARNAREDLPRQG